MSENLPEWLRKAKGDQGGSDDAPPWVEDQESAPEGGEANPALNFPPPERAFGMAGGLGFTPDYGAQVSAQSAPASVSQPASSRQAAGQLPWERAAAPPAQPPDPDTLTPPWAVYEPPNAPDPGTLAPSWAGGAPRPAAPSAPPAEDAGFAWDTGEQDTTFETAPEAEGDALPWMMDEDAGGEGAGAQDRIRVEGGTSMLPWMQQGEDDAGAGFEEEGGFDWGAGFSDDAAGTEGEEEEIDWGAGFSDEGEGLDWLLEEEETPEGATTIDFAQEEFDEYVSQQAAEEEKEETPAADDDFSLDFLADEGEAPAADDEEFTLDFLTEEETPAADDDFSLDFLMGEDGEEESEEDFTFDGELSLDFLDSPEYDEAESAAEEEEEDLSWLTSEEEEAGEVEEAPKESWMTMIEDDLRQTGALTEILGEEEEEEIEPLPSLDDIEAELTAEEEAERPKGLVERADDFEFEEGEVDFEGEFDFDEAFSSFEDSDEIEPMSDWLGEIGTPVEEEAPPEPAADIDLDAIFGADVEEFAPAEEDAGSGDWLADLDALTEQQAAQETSSEEAPSDGIGVDLGALAEAEEMAEDDLFGFDVDLDAADEPEAESQPDAELPTETDAELPTETDAFADFDFDAAFAVEGEEAPAPDADETFAFEDFDDFEVEADEAEETFALDDFEEFEPELEAPSPSEPQPEAPLPPPSGAEPAEEDLLPPEEALVAPTDEEMDFALLEGDVSQWLAGRGVAMQIPPDVPIASLPERLRALSYDRIAPGGNGHSPEKGPLAGIENPLAALEGSDIGGASAVRPGLIAANAAQQENAALIRDMFGRVRAPETGAPAAEGEDLENLSFGESGEGAEEGAISDEPQPVEEAKPADQIAERRVESPWGRLFVTFLMLVAVIVPVIVQPGLADTLEKGLLPARLDGFAAAVEQVAADGRVLLAFEYTPAQAGELDAAARATVRHLLDKGAYLVGISTNPIAAQHSRLILDQIAGDAKAIYGEDYVSVRYVSGGQMALRALSANSRNPDAAPPTRFFVQDYRTEPTGLLISELSDFDLIIVFAGTDIALRDWVEQVATPSGVRTLAVTGAAVEQIAKPYLRSGQLAGYMAGYRDTMTYEQARIPNSQEAQSATRRWEAVTVGASLAALLITLGTALNLFRAVRRRRRQS